MKIAEKLITIAENQEKVYDAGKQSMIDESKIIEKTVTGHGYVSANDVSEIPHDIRVKLTSDTIEDLTTVKLYKQRKNLIPYPYQQSTTTINGITFTDNGDGTITANGTAEETATLVIKQHIKLTKGKSYVWSGCPSGGNPESYGLFFQDETYKQGIQGYGKAQVFIAEYEDYYCWIKIIKGTTVNNLVFKPQLELGTTQTEYERYMEPIVYDVNADGIVEEVKSISPIMALYTIPDVEIQMTYHKSFGMQTEYDRFWDAYQDCGNRSNYRGAFCSGMTPSNFYPKYDIKPNNVYHCFCMFGLNEGEKPIDFVERLEECGVVLDMSGIGSTGYTFCWTSAVKRLGVLDLQTPTNLNNGFFSMSSCVSIDKVILKDDGSQTMGNAFSENINLKNIAFEGTIGTSLQLQSSPLTVDSMKNIISHLKNYVGTDKESTQTIKFSGACWTALEDSGTSPNGETWKSYVQSDLGWLV